MFEENLSHTGNRFPDRPARSESLYRLLHPDPLIVVIAALFPCKRSLKKHDVEELCRDAVQCVVFWHHKTWGCLSVQCLAWIRFWVCPSFFHFSRPAKLFLKAFFSHLVVGFGLNRFVYHRFFFF